MSDPKTELVTSGLRDWVEISRDMGQTVEQIDAAFEAAKHPEMENAA